MFSFVRRIFGFALFLILICRIATGAELPADVKACFEQIDAVYADVKTYQANVLLSVKINFENQEYKSALSSSLVWEKPNRIKVFTSDKQSSGVLMVSDGKTFIKYLPQEKEYVIKPASDGLRDSDAMRSGSLGQISGIADVTASGKPSEILKEDLLKASMKESVQIDGTPHKVINLVKKLSDKQVSIDLFMEEKTGRIRKMIFDNKPLIQEKDGDDEMAFLVTDEHVNIRLNEKLGEDVFQFIPPNDANKVDEFTFAKMRRQAEEKAAEEERKNPLEGKAAPAFKLQDMKGKTHILEQYKGNAVILDFWATFCPPCQKEMPVLQKISAKWEPKGVIILTINSSGEPEEKIKGFMNRFNLSLPVLLDKTGNVGEAYNVQFIPQLVLVDKSGIIKKVIIGLMSEEDLEKEIENLIK